MEATPAVLPGKGPVNKVLKLMSIALPVAAGVFIALYAMEASKKKSFNIWS